jgi:hypothetical protein
VCVRACGGMEMGNGNGEEAPSGTGNGSGNGVSYRGGILLACCGLQLAVGKLVQGA